MTLIVAALEQEFPFKNEFNILYTDVGKVNASINLLTYLEKNKNIDTIINVGSAGGIDVPTNSVVECGTFIDGELNYPGYVLETITHNPTKLTIATFDTFQTKIPLRYCNCVDMESFVFAKICEIKKLKFLCYKYISDRVGDTNQETNWLENYQNGRYLLKEKVISNL